MKDNLSRCFLRKPKCSNLMHMYVCVCVCANVNEGLVIAATHTCTKHSRCCSCTSHTPFCNWLKSNKAQLTENLLVVAKNTLNVHDSNGMSAGSTRSTRASTAMKWHRVEWQTFWQNYYCRVQTHIAGCNLNWIFRFFPDFFFLEIEHVQVFFSRIHLDEQAERSFIIRSSVSAEKCTLKILNSSYTHTRTNLRCDKLNH